MTADPNLAPIPAAQRSQIVGMTAQVALVRGELLTRAQLTTGSGFTAGQQLVALPLKQGQFPGARVGGGAAGVDRRDSRNQRNRDRDVPLLVGRLASRVRVSRRRWPMSGR